MPYRNIFELLYIATESSSRKQEFSEQAWNLQNIIFDARHSVINRLSECIENKVKISSIEIDKISNEIEALDKELLLFANDIICIGIEEINNRAGKETLNIAKYATIKASSESRPASFVVKKNNECWVSAWSEMKHWIQFDFNRVFKIDKISINHHGVRELNTRDFTIQSSTNAVNWNDCESIKGNWENTTIHYLNMLQSQYIRIYITNPSINDTIARIRYVDIQGEKI